MRIIAGSLSGRVFDAPRGQRTHPMSDRVRGALFNALGDIAGLTVLDAFAGSGALGFEAISRSAAHATLIEADKSAQQTITGNIDQLAVQDRVKLVHAKAGSWLATTEQSFDIVLCDPPYDAVNTTLLTRLADRAKPSGVVVLSLPPKHTVTLADNYDLLQQKDYGDATLSFYRRLA